MESPATLYIMLTVVLLFGLGFIGVEIGRLRRALRDSSHELKQEVRRRTDEQQALLGEVIGLSDSLRDSDAKRGDKGC